MNKIVVMALAGIAMTLSPAAFAGGEQGHQHSDGMHGHGQMQEMATMEMDHAGMFLETKIIDGYQTTFHVMKAPEGLQKHVGTHHLMFKAEKDGKVLNDLTVNSKITHPDGHSNSSMMMKMGDWYMAGYNLSHPGDHKLMVLFKTADGSKHFGGIIYNNKDEK